MAIAAVLKKTLGISLMASALVLAGCGGNKDDSAQESSAPLKVGVISGPEAELMQTAIANLKAEKGIEAELIEFQDYITPNIALADGSIDVNAFQHKPYLDNMVNDRGFKLASVGNTFVYPIGGYSQKIAEFADLPEGGIIAIPNDPSDEGRALILLHNTGLIKLKDITNLEATVNDIAENPKNIKFVELEAPQLPRSLPDVDLAIINSTFATPAGLTIDKALLVEDKQSPYVNLIVAREDNKGDTRIIQLVEAFQSKAVNDKATELFKGGAVKGW